MRFSEIREIQRHVGLTNKMRLDRHGPGPRHKEYREEDSEEERQREERVSNFSKILPHQLIVTKLKNSSKTSIWFLFEKIDI